MQNSEFEALNTWLNALGQLIWTVNDPLHVHEAIAEKAEPAQYLANTGDDMGLQLASWEEQGYPAAHTSKHTSAA